MPEDQPFRIALIVGALIVTPIAAFYRIRSQMTGEKLDRRQEGLFILFSLRPIAFAGIAVLISFMINPAWVTWSSIPLPNWVRWAGVGIAALGGVLLIWVFRTLGPNLTDTVVTRQKHTLVTTGPYRWVRHPFYDSFALSIGGNAVAAGNWFVFLTGATVLTLLVIRAKREEANLLARFGETYETYAKKTGRFFPRIGASS